MPPTADPWLWLILAFTALFNVVCPSSRLLAAARCGSVSRVAATIDEFTPKPERVCPANPDFSPGDAMIAQDLSRLRVPATESIAVALVEGARARKRDKDKRGRIKRSM